MILYILNHKYHYEMENLCRVFYPAEALRCIKAQSHTVQAPRLLPMEGVGDLGSPEEGLAERRSLHRLLVGHFYASFRGIALTFRAIS